MSHKVGRSEQQPRSGRRRRAARGNLRRHTTVDGVTIEETISFSMPTPGNGNNGYGESIRNNTGDTEEIGDGCYVTSTINNRRYYGILIDQPTLLKASELHFMEEAASLDMNRRMKFLYEKQEEKNEIKKKRSLTINVSNKDNHSREINSEMLELNSMQEGKRQKLSSSIPISDSSNTILPTTSNSTHLPINETKRNENKDQIPTSKQLLLYKKEKQVQKFEYILPTMKDKNSPGYRKLLATFASISAASEDHLSKSEQIYEACQKGGDFVGRFYYQYQVDETAVEAKHASKSQDSMIGFRTSLSLHSFLKTVNFPAWYPLSNFKVDQSKILTMLNMKRNNKGGIEFEKQKPPEETPPIKSSIRHTVVNPMKPLVPIQPRNTYRIGVIGGGIAGLSCCWELLRLARESEKLEIEVTLFEGRPRVGGRLHTDTSTFQTTDQKPFPVDLGASWIHGIEKNPLTDLAKDAKVDFVRAAEEVKMLTSNMREVDKDRDKKMGKLFDELLDQATEGCWSTEEYIYKDGRHQNAIRWYASHLTDTASNSPKPTDVSKHRHTSDISVDRAIGLALKQREDRIHLSIQDQNLLLWNTKNTEYALGANIADLSMKYWDADERHAFKGDHVLLKQGYSKIVKFVYDKCQSFPNFSHKLDFPVGKIEYARNSEAIPYPNRKLRLERCIDLSNVCAVYSRDGTQKFDFDFVVSALPLGVLKNSIGANQNEGPAPSQAQTESNLKNNQNSGTKQVIFDPPLPLNKQDAIETVGFGLLNKVYLQFSHPFWRRPEKREFLRGLPYLGLEQDIFGNASGYNPHHYMFLDVGHSVSSDQNPPAVLLTLISGREAVWSEQMSQDALVEDVMKTLQHLFSGIHVPKPIAVRRTKWGQDEFSRGSYTYLPPGSSDQDYQTLQNPVYSHGDSVDAAILGLPEVMRLFFAGEHTTSLHPSMAHGAFLSGIRAAREIVANTILEKKKKEDRKNKDHLIPVSQYRMKRPKDPVRCSLCHFPGSRRREGPLCAFQKGKNLALVHMNCASYCPEVDVKLGAWKNVMKAVIRGKQINCHLCRRNGATIGCIHPQCNRSFHFGCCEDTGWSFLRNGKGFLCDQHRNNLSYNTKDENLSLESNSDVDNPISIPYFRSKNPYAPIQCSFCKGVGDGENEGQLLGFQRGKYQRLLVHTNCLQYSTVIDTWDPSTQTFHNVFDALFRSKPCALCLKPGGTIQCSHSDCNSHYHFKCAEATGWNFENEDVDYFCPLHRPSTHIAKSTSLIVPPLPPPKSFQHLLHKENSSFTPKSNITKNLENKSETRRFIQHDLFCSGASSSKGSDAVHLPAETSDTPSFDKSLDLVKNDPIHINESRNKMSFNPPISAKSGPTTIANGAPNHIVESSGSEYESGSDYTNDDSNDDDSDKETGEENNLMQPFTMNPHIADEDIGRTYVHSIFLKANRITDKNPWNIDFMMDCSTSSKTTTLRVDSRQNSTSPKYGMRKGDIILEINHSKIGSPTLLNITNILALMKASTELHFMLLRKSNF